MGGAVGKSQNNRLFLEGEKFVILGASAELAPTNLLLEAGASVLWVDIQDATTYIEKNSNLAGRLYFAEGARNLLTEAREIRAAIEEFSDGDPIHIGMFAYAAGASQEWRLTASMNGIVQNLDSSLVKSVSMLISPTSVAVMQEEDIAYGQEQFENPSPWLSLAKTLGRIKDSSFTKGKRNQ